jgi:hypothetical protein
MRGMVLRIRQTQHDKSRQSSARVGEQHSPRQAKKSTKMPEGEHKQDKQATQAQARQVIDVFHEISTLLVGNFVARRDFKLIDNNRMQTSIDRLYPFVYH